MRNIRWQFGSRAAVILVVLGSAFAHASEHDKLTYFTFKESFQVPGKILPPGTYQFKLADPDSNRNFVHVLSRDGKKVHALFFTMRGMERDRPANEPLVAFRETAPGIPEAIRGWFYPGEHTGYEFVYPKKQAREIAGRVHQPVLATAARVPSETASIEAVASEFQNEPVERVDEQGKTEPLDKPIVTATSPLQALDTARVNEQPAPVLKTRTELPKTASAQPLAALVGVSSLLLGLGVHRVRRRLADRDPECRA
jgi:LPXTG-motif cell wall-anchored protein